MSTASHKSQFLIINEQQLVIVDHLVNDDDVDND